MFELNFYNSTKEKKWTKNFFNKILLGVQKAKVSGLKQSKSYALSIHIVGDARIRSLNNKYRNKNKTTNVLSFPTDDKLIGKRVSKYDIIDLGDIFISLPTSKIEARTEHITLRDKLRTLVVHGFIHLIGYDHDRSDKENTISINLQNKLIEHLVNN